jgi:hypothetical protein
VLDEVDSESSFGPVDSVEGSIAANPQLEQTLPLAGQWLRREGIEILRQPTELVENSLGYGLVQAGKVIPGLRPPLQVVHVTTPGQVERQLPEPGCP